MGDLVMRRLIKFIRKSAKWLLMLFVIVAALAFLIFNVYIVSVAECVPRNSENPFVDSSQEPNLPIFSGMNHDAQTRIEVAAESFNRPLAQDAISQNYAFSSVLLAEGDSLDFTATIPSDGEYSIAFDMAVPAESIVPEGGMTVDGAFPITALQRFLFPIYYRNASNIFPVDRYGNDAFISQVRQPRWTNAPLQDVNFSEAYPVRLSLSAGEHSFNLTLSKGALYLGKIYFIPFSPYPAYADYLAQASGSDSTGVSLVIQAEMPSYKNDTSVRPNNSRSLSVTPYDTYCQLMNTMGGDTWVKSGTAVYYEIDVPQDGFYTISLRTLQNTRSNFDVFRRITINGEVPFAELNAYPFPYSLDWLDITLGGETPYKIFLRAGVNTIGVEATNAPYLHAIQTIQASLLDINALSLEIRQLTGNQRDPYKEWLISDYIPDIEERLLAIAQKLIDDKNSLLSNTSPESLTYQMAIDNLLFLASEPNQIPIYMSRFSEGSGSAAQQLGSLLPLLQSQPLGIDIIRINSPDILPERPSVSLIDGFVEDYKRFVYSFTPDPYRSLTSSEGELEVWVNRPRQYVNLLQWLADSTFTPETGIRVRFSIMPDEGKLVLANAANIQPDVALGVSTDRPYELAIRNALYDLRSFEDFDSYISVFSPGSLLGYIINDSVYALPETQDFWVTYYRRDILEATNIPVPDTWDEVIEILPELQRYGMNYNTALSSGTGYKNYLLTAPYLFNYGVELYADNGFSTGLVSEEAIDAIEFMGDSFTIYGMPLTTANFYQDFRIGRIPIGISNLETYMKLTSTAPEINGLWGIDLYPATVAEDGTERRYATGSAQTGIMFQNTDMPEEGWQFLKWWMSTETQTEFAEQLLLSYGAEYLWFSANLEAMNHLAIPEEHRSVILEQWEWLQEPVRLPGSYMQERELSNIWNRIVFDGANPRVAVDRSIITINREITRKMEEFGYLQDGLQVREFRVPTIETVIGWVENAD
jgi:ABC-type glycerol-3-phosphate transport system substrate-binding protein